MKLRYRTPFVALAFALQGCPNTPLPPMATTPSSSPTASTQTAAATPAPTPAPGAAAMPSPAPGTPGGPPPTGFSQVSLDAGGQHINGEALAMLLDGNGDPQFAYVDNTSGSGFPVYFRAWDRQAGAWKSPVRVGVMGTPDGGSSNLGTTDMATEVALVRDPSNGALAIAYPSDSGGPNTTLHLATSLDHGATWQDHGVDRISEYGVVLGHPSLASSGGRLYLAYRVEDDNTPPLPERHEWHFDTFSPDGTRLDATFVPWPSAVPRANDTYYEPSVAVDAAGQPAVAFSTRGYTDGQTTNPTHEVIAYWRPGWSDSAVIDDKLDESQAGSWGHSFVKLAFDGTRPRVAYLGTPFGGTYSLLTATSSDGKAWDPGVTVPRDYAEWWRGLSLAIDSHGRGAIANGGNSSRDDKCGYPKLARTNDFKTWNTCSPDATNTAHFDTASWPVIAFDAHDKLTMLFWNDEQFDAPMKPGYVLWREP